MEASTKAEKSGGLFDHYWTKHPLQRELAHILREGEWVTHVFEWIFMMVSRFAGYLMTLAVGYLILYVIDAKHGLEAIPLHPQLPDQLALFSNTVINVTPELVFPGVVVLCIRAFTVRRWWDGVLYMVTAIGFAILTMKLLNAFSTNTIDKDFLAAMLFWRAGAALFYTVVVAYCGSHGGMDLRSLLRELDTVRGQLDSGQQTVSSLQEELNTAVQRSVTLEEQLSTVQREVSRLHRDLTVEQQRASKVQAELETGEGESVRLRRELNVALVEVETLRTQLDGKQRELANVRELLEGGQEFAESRVRAILETEQQRVESLQQQLNAEQSVVVDLRKQVNTTAVELDRLHQQLDGKQQEVEQARTTLQRRLEAMQREMEGTQTTLQQQLDAKQQEVERLQRVLTSEQQTVSSLRQQLDSASSVQSAQVSTGQGRKVDSGQSVNRVNTGQGKVVQLDTSRPRKSGQDESVTAEQIRELVANEPGISGRKIAERLGCSPTTASKWMKFFEEGGQLSVNG